MPTAQFRETAKWRKILPLLWIGRLLLLGKNCGKGDKTNWTLLVEIDIRLVENGEGSEDEVYAGLRGEQGVLDELVGQSSGGSMGQGQASWQQRINKAQRVPRVSAIRIT